MPKPINNENFAPSNSAISDFKQKTVLVTGGTGSFGTAFVKQILKNTEVEKLIIFSRDEQKHFLMAQNPIINRDDRVRFFLGDVRDISRLELAMRGVNIVVHAAAMKHVALSEYNPLECIKTNVGGAENVVRTAIGSNVEKVIALSTDKACSPNNLYGASKLASDKIFVSANNLSGLNGTRFSVVRYGNVIGSKGSVIPYFEKLIDEGCKFLPITDPEMTRFWITLEHGVNFVISSISSMKGGEIFVPKIPSMKIVDLANYMAPQIKKKVIGIRPGEKLHEAMTTIDDARNLIEFKDRFILLPALKFWNKTETDDYHGKPVEKNFVYSSDTNQNCLTEAEFKALLTRSREDME